VWKARQTPAYGGLAVATVLTLIFLPALYVAWFRIKAPEPAMENTHENPLAPEAQADLSADALTHRELETA
jgi:hypothetical protein